MSLPLVYWIEAPVPGSIGHTSTAAPVSCVNLYRRTILYHYRHLVYSAAKHNCNNFSISECVGQKIRAKVINYTIYIYDYICIHAKQLIKGLIYASCI